MSKINWKIRLKNKTFWMTFIPALLVLVKQVLSIFGIDFDLSAIQDQVLNLVASIFALLGIMGVVTDPTTHGVADSERALTYETVGPRDSYSQLLEEQEKAENESPKE